MPQIKLSEKCGRCPREELTAVTLDEAVARVKNQGPKHKALVIFLDGKETVTYDYLCEECRGIVSSYVSGTEKQVKRSARRYKKVKAADLPDRDEGKLHKAKKAWTGQR